MKKYLLGMTMAALALWSAFMPIHAATVGRGYTFATNEQVTAAKLHTLVDSATVTAIGSADITDGAIANADLGANCVTTDKILDGTILGTDLANRTLTTALYGTNSVDGIALSTNIDYQSGLYVYTNANTTLRISSTVNLTNATLGFGANQIPYAALPIGTVTNKSNIVSTNLVTATGSGSINTWATIATIATTATSGTVRVQGFVVSSTASGSQYIRIRDTGNTATNTFSLDVNAQTPVYGVELMDTLSGAAKTYNLEVAASGASQIYTNAAAAPPISNALGMKILQIP